MRSTRRRAWRWAAGAGAVLALLATGLALWGRPTLAVRGLQRRVDFDYLAARRTPLSVMESPPTSFTRRWLAALPAALKRAVDAVEPDLTGFAVRELRFSTVDRQGQVRPVTALVLTPVADAGELVPGDNRLGAEHLTPASFPAPGAPSRLAGGPAEASAPTDVVIYLPSSGALQGPVADLEALTAAMRLGRARRVVVLPLPAAEQRGAPWPSLAGVDIEQAHDLLRQCALDARRLADVIGERGWRVTGIAGASLGGVVAADLVGLHPELFAGGDLQAWGAGGDLPRLVAQSDHPLARALAQPEGMGRGEWEARLAALDPVSHAARARLKSATLSAGWRDETVPPECTQALVQALEAHGVPAQMLLDDAGHPGLSQSLGALAEVLQRLR